LSFRILLDRPKFTSHEQNIFS